MHYFSKLKYEKALEIVCTETADKKLFGQYASVFLDKVPKQTLQALTQNYGKFSNLRLDKFVISLHKIDKKHYKEAAAFLQTTCIKEWRTNVRAVFNLVLYFYL